MGLLNTTPYNAYDCFASTGIAFAKLMPSLFWYLGRSKHSSHTLTR